MFSEDIRNILKERIRISEETQDNWDYGIESCWQQTIDIISNNIEAAIAFLNNECTADEFSWLSEIADDVAAKTHNREFVYAMKNLCKKYPDEVEKYNIMQVLEIAESYL